MLTQKLEKIKYFSRFINSSPDFSQLLLVYPQAATRLPELHKQLQKAVFNSIKETINK